MKLLLENWREYLNENESITPILDEADIEKIITGPEFSFNSLQSSKHRWGYQRPIIDYYFDEQNNNWSYTAYTSNNPDKPDLMSKRDETLENFLTRVEKAPQQTELNIPESLYYGTSTTLQEEIAENGIKSPSKWGDYGFAEENAFKIVEEHGGEPVIIQIPLSEFNKEHFLLDEDKKDTIVYTEDLSIFMEKQQQKLL
jgi:hypothetical protein